MNVRGIRMFIGWGFDTVTWNGDRVDALSVFQSSGMERRLSPIIHYGHNATEL